MIKKYLSQHDLIYEKAPERWLDCIPLANGDIGAAIWGHGAPLRITLDKYDAWELREQPLDWSRHNYREMKRLVQEKNDAELKKTFEPGRDDRQQGLPSPTRLPLPQLIIDFGVPPQNFSARLNVYDACVSGELLFPNGKALWQALVHSQKNLLVFEITRRGKLGAPKVKISRDHLNQPDEGIPRLCNGASTVNELLKKWGYPDPQEEAERGMATYFQEIPEAGGYAIALKQVSSKNKDVFYVSVISKRNAPHPRAEAIRMVEDAAATSWPKLMKDHASFWHDYWERNFLTLPDAKMESLFYVEMYKLGCISREGKLPCTLQGLWTQGDGGMPPWAGDYHLDMNVQESYWPVYTGNHLENGMALYEHFWKILPRFKDYCQKFFGFEGAHARCEMGLNGERLFGYYTANFWPGNGVWLAHHFWLHWRYSQDRPFLRDRAYPFMRPFMQMYMNLLEKDADGKYHLPLSYSPETHENSLSAWGKDATGDLFLIRWLASALLETVKILRIDDPDAPRWRDVLDHLAEPSHDDCSGLHVQFNQGLQGHRHHSHLMGIHPLGNLNIDGTDKDRKLIDQSLYTIRAKGTGTWTGWSFPWMSLIASRAQNGHMAWQMLEEYFCFIAPNTFHLNGDPRRFGVSLFDYEPMTLEGGLCAAAAIMEMLLQSWGGIIRVFPSIPSFWHDGYFRDLRAEGAFLVTAKMLKRKVIFVEITSEAGGICRVKNPFDQDVKIVRCHSKERHLAHGKQIEFKTHPGDVFLLYPKWSTLSAKDLQPTRVERKKTDQNIFGLKLLPRF